MTHFGLVLFLSLGFGKTIGISLNRMRLQNVVLSSLERICLEVQDTSKINYSGTYLIQKLLFIKDDYFSIWDAYFLIIRDFLSTYSFINNQNNKIIYKTTTKQIKIIIKKYLITRFKKRGGVKTNHFLQTLEQGINSNHGCG